MLSEEYPDLGVRSPRSLGGATADRPPVDAPPGRSGWLVDPFGHRWNVMTPAGAVTADDPPA